MYRFFLTIPVMVAGLAMPAQAFDPESMTPAEREAFHAEIRSYLLENPDVIVEAIEVLEQRRAEALSAEDVTRVQSNSDAIFHDDHSWVGGNPEGDITLVEFLDYRCGFCRRAAPEVHDLVELDGNIRFVIKEYPILGEQSVMSSRFAIATKQLAGDEAYKAAHDALVEFDGEVNEATLRRIGESLGLEYDAIIAHMDSPDVNRVIAENHTLAQRLDISGTPTFVMGDKLLRGYLPLQDMQQLAEEIRTQ